MVTVRKEDFVVCNQRDAAVRTVLEMRDAARELSAKQARLPERVLAQVPERVLERLDEPIPEEEWWDIVDEVFERMRP